MAKTLYELAMEYLNQGMPDITQTPRVTPPGTLPPITLPPQDPNAPVKRILPMPSGGGDGFGVYNPDPNSTRTKSNYREDPYKSALYGNSFSMMGDPIANQATGALNTNGLMSYAGDKPPTGLESLMGKIMKPLNYLGSKFPVSSRATFENELLGSGVMLDDIGRVVSNDYNTVEGIMSGYNANQIDASTFQKRRDMINRTIARKKAKGQDTSVLENRIGLIDGAEKLFDDTKTKADMVFDDKSLAKDPTYKSLADKIATGNAINLEKEDDENIDIFDPNNKIKNTSVFTKTPTDVFYDDFPDTVIDKDNNDFKGIVPITGGTNQNDFQGIVPITGGENLNDFQGIVPITGGTNLNDYTGLGPITGGTNLNDYTGLGPITGGTNLNDYTGLGPITGGTNQNDYTGNMGPITGGMNLNDYSGGPITGGTNLNDYDSGYNAGSGYSSGKSSNLGGPAGQGTATAKDTYTDAITRGNTGSGNDSSSNSRDKIVCTMMNESYGFGLFRNKIWMKFHKDLAPEYQKGYHKIFLPLIKIAKRNKIVKKVLEHIAIHSTIDMRQATRGKTHLLGRVYRKILLPLCYFVGKNG